jgi:hypothetical protein
LKNLKTGNLQTEADRVYGQNAIRHFIKIYFELSTRRKKRLLIDFIKVELKQE